MQTIAKPPAGNPGDLLSQIKGIADISELLKDPDNKHLFERFHQDVRDWIKWKDDVRGVSAVADLLNQARDEIASAKAKKQMMLEEIAVARREFEEREQEARNRLQAESMARTSQIEADAAKLAARLKEVNEKERALDQDTDELARAQAAARQSAADAAAVRMRFEEKERQLKAFLGG